MQHLKQILLHSKLGKEETKLLPKSKKNTSMDNIKQHLKTTKHNTKHQTHNKNKDNTKTTTKQPNT